MKKLAIMIFVAALPAFGWEKVCTFTFDKKYDGIHLGKVQVYREKDQGTWSYAVGLSGVSIAGHQCEKNERLTGYISAKVRSAAAGYLDTGDLKVRGSARQTYWKFFDKAFLRNCGNGVRIWTSWVCEKTK